MEYIAQYESFPWEDHIQKYNFTLTKEKIIESTINQFYFYKINSTSFKNISYSFGNVNYITIIDSKNIDKYVNTKLFNVYFYVDDENNLFDNFFKIYNNFYGWISFKFKNINTYDKQILNKELIKIKEFYIDLLKHKIYIPINELEGYIYDKNFIFIKDDFNCILNPYYYESNNLFSLLDINTNYEIEQINFSNQFLEIDKILKQVFDTVDVDIDILDYNKMIKEYNLYRKMYLIELEQ